MAVQSCTRQAFSRTVGEGGSERGRGLQRRGKRMCIYLEHAESDDLVLMEDNLLR